MKLFSEPFLAQTPINEQWQRQYQMTLRARNVKAVGLSNYPKKNCAEITTICYKNHPHPKARLSNQSD